VERRLLTTTGVFGGLVEPGTEEDLLDDADSRPCPICGVADSLGDGDGGMGGGKWPLRRALQ
jgi:hypothetical protein